MKYNQSITHSGGLTKSSPLRKRSPAHLLSPIRMPTATLSFNRYGTNVIDGYTALHKKI